MVKGGNQVDSGRGRLGRLARDGTQTENRRGEWSVHQDPVQWEELRNTGTDIYSYYWHGWNNSLLTFSNTYT